MKQPPSTGACQLCKGKFDKPAMTRHLTACLDKAKPQAGAKKTNVFVLQVQGKYNPEYWLYLEAPASASFGDVDAFLRDIWLECCGHMSAFDLGRGQPESWDDVDSFEEGEDETMALELGETLEPKMAFGYEYDFGSTTNLQLKVVAMREGTWKGKEKVRLLARNDAPQLACQECGKPATKIDPDEGSLYCAKCAKKPERTEGYDFLPVVNSPRVGVCGYTG